MRYWPVWILLIVTGLTVAACEWGSTLFLSLFGPPAVQLEEAYGAGSPGASFDHAAFDRVLQARVDADGYVDYRGLAADPADLDTYLAQLAAADLQPLGRDQRLALLINAYNAFTLKLILDHLPLQSIRDIPDAERWDAQRWQLGGATVSLSALEHDELRAKFREPRIHFAINCASIGCPPLRRRAYTGAAIDAELQEQSLAVHRDRRWFRLDAARNGVGLTRIYQWYAGDFEQVAGTVTAYAARFVPELAKALEAGQSPTVVWLAYDWSLNAAR